MEKTYFDKDERELILYAIRAFLLILLITLFLFTFTISYKKILYIAFNLFTLFLIFSITYFLFVENKQDRKLLNGIWRIYFPSIIVLFTMVSNIDTYVTNCKIDYYKTELNYYLTIGDKERLKSIHDNYVEIYNSHIVHIFEKEKVKNIVQDSNEKQQESNEYIFWYANFLINMVNCLSLLMFLKCFTELSKFKIRIKKDVNIKVYQKGRFINR